MYVCMYVKSFEILLTYLETFGCCLRLYDFNIKSDPICRYRKEAERGIQPLQLHLVQGALLLHKNGGNINICWDATS